ncbi:alpha/beta hydrolase [Nocardia iowensis]|uniref:Alpha/beta hydrolase n=1 Tax=Nocardia iowensis TaxID=204891 RepID=A0ABX8RPI9_NOCIO|nr:alpha/beta hydrolase [Nocardia iowensis]QXN91554.1 alpha/beta hydrolase [Nocardia iowensis]
MTAIEIPVEQAHLPDGPKARSSVTVEIPNRASLISRVINPLLFATVRASLETLSIAGEYGPVRSKRIFTISSYTDAPAAVLVAVAGTRRRTVLLDNCHAEWVWHRGTADPGMRTDTAILYFHGGGFVSCGLRTHRRIVSKIARASNMPVLNVAYRQLPQAHITDSIADGVAAYRYLLNRGFSGERIIVAGDSAGAGLAFSVALAARAAGLPVPGGITALAPWADLDPAAKYAHPNALRDPVIPIRGLDLITRWGYRIGGELDPAWSPVDHDFTGLPPALILVGSNEVLLADAEQLAARCGEAGVPCRLQIWDRQAHVFVAGADILPEGRAAFREIGAFHQQVLTGSTVAYRGRLRRLFRGNAAA